MDRDCYSFDSERFVKDKHNESSAKKYVFNNIFRQIAGPIVYEIGKTGKILLITNCGKESRDFAPNCTKWSVVTKHRKICDFF